MMAFFQGCFQTADLLHRVLLARREHVQTAASETRSRQQEQAGFTIIKLFKSLNYECL
jgi:hypothetical protein